MSEDVLSAEVDAATQKITETAAPGVEVILGTAFKEEMSDEMVITVIAAGYEEKDAPESAVPETLMMQQATVQQQPVPVPQAQHRITNPLVNEGFVPVEPRRQPQKPSGAIPRLDNDDDDINEILKILDKR